MTGFPILWTCVAGEGGTSSVRLSSCCANFCFHICRCTWFSIQEPRGCHGAVCGTPWKIIVCAIIWITKYITLPGDKTVSVVDTVSSGENYRSYVESEIDRKEWKQITNNSDSFHPKAYLWLISNLMHKILTYLHIIHLLKSSTCFEHYPAHIQEVYIVTVYMQPLVSSLVPNLFQT